MHATASDDRLDRADRARPGKSTRSRTRSDQSMMKASYRRAWLGELSERRAVEAGQLSGRRRKPQKFERLLVGPGSVGGAARHVATQVRGGLGQQKKMLKGVVILSGNEEGVQGWGRRTMLGHADTQCMYIALITIINYVKSCARSPPPPPPPFFLGSFDLILKQITCGF